MDRRNSPCPARRWPHLSILFNRRCHPPIPAPPQCDLSVPSPREAGRGPGRGVSSMQKWQCQIAPRSHQRWLLPRQSDNIAAMNSSTGEISSAPFGQTRDGRPVDLYTLRNVHGVEVRLTNYGGIVTSWLVPDRQGRPGDVVLGYDALDGYLKATPYFGCLVGRYCNRIAKGRFTLNGVTRQLAVNNGPNSLHGGLRGFDKVVWQAKPLMTPDGPAVELSYLSPDGEEGFPGNLSVKAVYLLTQDNGLRLDFTATTDQDTIVNLTQHSYFNLAGRGDILNHAMQINADQFTPVDSSQIPTGRMQAVAGTPFDFRQPAAIGARIDQNDDQLKFGAGYDHNWVANKPPGKLDVVARVAERTSGRVLEVISTP